MKSKLLLFCILFSLLSVASNKEILLKSGKIQLKEINGNTTLSQHLLDNNIGNYALVQFDKIPTEEQKLILSQNGVQLLEYVPNNSFISHINKPSAISLNQLNISGIVAFSAEFKQTADFALRNYPNWAISGNKVSLIVEKQLNVSPQEFNQSLTSLGAEISFIAYSKEYVELTITESKVNDLLNDESVKFVDFIPAPAEKEDARGRSLHRANMLYSDHALGRKYDGTGVTLAIADDGAIGPHIDIKGRVTHFVNIDAGTHGDMTTGIAMGAGNLNPDYRGMATGAHLFYYDIGGYPHISNAVSNLNNSGVVITSTSYSEGCNAGYITTTRDADQQSRQNPDLLHVFSAGNSSASTCGNNAYGAGTPWGTITGGRKQGKNTIATGNLEYDADLTNSSSRGPAADGRIKPDICANGTGQMSTAMNNNYQVGGGTSAAAPGIAGLSAQLYHGYRDLHNGANPDGALIKSAMLNTARDLGNKGPDFFYGWGRVNAHKAMTLIEEQRYLDTTISQNETIIHTVTINNAVEQLRLMVYWNDFEGSTASSIALVNNLDIEVVTPNNDTLLPWVLNSTPIASALSQPAVRGVDNLNNMEQVTIDTAAAGTYQIIVRGKAIPQGPQKYFMLWEEKKDEIEVTYPHGGEGFVPGSTETLRWDAYGNSSSFSLEYSIDGGTIWNSISTVAGNLRFFDWTVPATISENAMVRVSRNGATGASNFTFTIISRPVGVHTNYICQDSIELAWNPVNGATAYTIYMLGATHMDSITTTSTTSAVLYNLNVLDTHWVSVQAIMNGGKGKRTNAIQLQRATNNCPVPYDLKVTQLNFPNVDYISNCNTNKLPIQVTINNGGDSALTNVPFRCTFGNTTLYDTLVGPFNSGGFQFFQFSDSILVSAVGDFTISVISDLANDNDETNDSIAKLFTVYSSQTTITPYSEDFETFGVCPTTNNCGTTICNLGNGWINVSSVRFDDFDMRTNSGTTPTTSSGPSSDHTIGNTSGKYIYSEASNGCYGVESHVMSSCIDLSNTIDPELSYWHHLNGANMGIVRVDIMADGRWTNNVSSVFGNQGTAWNESTVDLTNYIGKIINIRFRVVTGSSWASDLALDDVTVYDKSTDVQELLLGDFKIFPNPSNGVFKVSFKSTKNRVINVYDIKGRVVLSKNVLNATNQIDLSTMNSGIYFLEVVGEDKRHKIIVQ